METTIAMVTNVPQKLPVPHKLRLKMAANSGMLLALILGGIFTVGGIAGVFVFLTKDKDELVVEQTTKSNNLMLSVGLNSNLSLETTTESVGENQGRETEVEIRILKSNQDLELLTDFAVQIYRVGHIFPPDKTRQISRNMCTLSKINWG